MGASPFELSLFGSNGSPFGSRLFSPNGSPFMDKEEHKEADSTTGQAAHRISRGIHDKGQTLLRHLKSDGQVDTMQTLHNINEGMRICILFLKYFYSLQLKGLVVGHCLRLKTHMPVGEDDWVQLRMVGHQKLGGISKLKMLGGISCCLHGPIALTPPSSWSVVFFRYYTGPVVLLVIWTPKSWVHQIYMSGILFRRYGLDDLGVRVYYLWGWEPCLDTNYNLRVCCRAICCSEFSFWAYHYGILLVLSLPFGLNSTSFYDDFAMFSI
ncbi:putative myeloid leukemia factor [Helianthus annuus]|nr:putative myeloid leukemia factor [Helianthus annuus]